MPPIQFNSIDCGILWEKLDSISEEYEDIYNNLSNDIYNSSPEKFFNNREQEHRLLSLNEVKLYESHLKKVCIDLNEKYPLFMKEVLHSFNAPTIESINRPPFIDLLNVLKQTNKLPCILFNQGYCIEILKDIHNEIENHELMEYPYHYKILEYKNKLYEEYTDRFELYKSNLKVDKSNKYSIDDKVNSFENREKGKYIQSVIEFYNQCINKLRSNKSQNKVQIVNLKGELMKFINSPDFSKPDRFQKHPKFSYSISEPMSESKIRDIRNRIRKSLNIKVSYESIIFQLLKRGIGIYLDEFPN